jgi:hypothetical protein
MAGSAGCKQKSKKQNKITNNIGSGKDCSLHILPAFAGIQNHLTSESE